MHETKKRSGGKVERMGRKVILVLLSVMLAGIGCISAPTRDEAITERLDQAKANSKAINPSDKYDIIKPLTLDEVIKIGMKNNLELRVQAINQDIARKETSAQKLQMLPGVDAGMDWAYRDELRKGYYGFGIERQSQRQSDPYLQRS